MQMAHEAFVNKHELTRCMGRWKLDTIQSEIWEGMIHDIQMGLQDVSVGHDHADTTHEVHAELEKHMQYFKWEARSRICSAKKQDRIKSETMTVTNPLSSSRLQNHI